MRKRYPDKTNILLVNITRLGDMLQATPTIAGMKEENPGSKVTVVVEKQFAEVCHSIPGIDEVVSLDLGMTVRSLARERDGIIDAYEYISEVIEDLKSRKFDYCFNMSSSAYTALLLKLLNVQRNGGWISDEEGYRVIESEWAKLFATSVYHQNRHYNSLNLVDVFRCSADVEKHPHQLLINVSDPDLNYAKKLVADAGFTNSGPLIAVQAGASQEKRQWSPARFIQLVKILTEKYNARVLLVGAKKELNIIEPIKAGCNSNNVFVCAGKTSIPQLAALLKISDVLITGDTGPMHVSVAVGTPVVAMFLASAFGFETGPYSEGNIVLQPIISCGPCNPNKPCAGLECHDTIEPELVAELTMMRVKEDFKALPQKFPMPKGVTIYRTFFDEFEFYDMRVLNPGVQNPTIRYRDAYRRLWLDDLADFHYASSLQGGGGDTKTSALRVVDDTVQGVSQVMELARTGQALISELIRLVRDVSAPARELAAVNTQLTELDRKIEQTGFHFGHLGPVTRMFIFAKENLCGTEAIGLASQMYTIYQDLERRAKKLNMYYATI